MGAGTGPLRGTQVFRMVVEFVDPTSLKSKPLPASVYKQFTDGLTKLFKTLPRGGVWTPKETSPPVSQGEILVRATLRSGKAHEFNCSLNDLMRDLRVWNNRTNSPFGGIVTKNIGPARSEDDPNHGPERGPAPLCGDPGRLILRRPR